ncbi:hypothetical protein F2Q69_00022863 [Brassica cretica]|uniref:Uncharacterized protein n=1 Tax=Brassica cretica TaxID=69181 RepID=A0A8S9QBQ8_BRACR|nr:hypothetical protein F2Q69_00022863 [Brassica cretica]
MGKAWKKDREPRYLSDKMSLKMIKEAAQQVVRGECSYSTYMSNSVEGSMVMKEQEIKGADERVTKKEWDEFVKHVSKSKTKRIQVFMIKIQHKKLRTMFSLLEKWMRDQSSGEEQVGPASSEEEQSVTLEIYYSNFSFTMVTKLKLWEVTFHPFGEWSTPKESLDKEGAVWISVYGRGDLGDGRRVTVVLVVLAHGRGDHGAGHPPPWAR